MKKVSEILIEQVGQGVGVGEVGEGGGGVKQEEVSEAESLRQTVPNRFASARKRSFSKCFCA